ncbi:unnamed protein product [Gongylonema pulchrum]|uniref:Uncharacterized protein n=1 Tax=Gongylonema pulchrum TaxID=637853 RepID=A0A183E6A0_9BILA|nr:unnamed protein product [Gongylonema pulchrum]
MSGLGCSRSGDGVLIMLPDRATAGDVSTIGDDVNVETSEPHRSQWPLDEFEDEASKDRFFLLADEHCPSSLKEF